MGRWINFGIFLLGLRKATKLDRALASSLLGLDEETLGAWEEGEILPPIEKLRLISPLYMISYDELLDVWESEKRKS